MNLMTLALLIERNHFIGFHDFGAVRGFFGIHDFTVVIDDGPFFNWRHVE